MALSAAVPVAVGYCCWLGYGRTNHGRPCAEGPWGASSFTEINRFMRSLLFVYWLV